ncbi:MAG TPA: hypothetical protein VE442_12355 [Jatrophihabitans sp.]|jgi:hypothetical protein|nr:hypothetical protein [Jatrophihabitans sp.]
MSAFTTSMGNTPGQLARLCEVLGARGVNLVVCAVAHGSTGTIAFIADDEAATHSALQDAGIDYTENKALTVRMQNVPGAGAGLFRKLADAGVNLNIFLPVQIFDDQFFAIICPSDVETARNALGDQVVAE